MCFTCSFAAVLDRTLEVPEMKTMRIMTRRDASTVAKRVAPVSDGALQILTTQHLRCNAARLLPYAGLNCGKTSAATPIVPAHGR